LIASGSGASVVEVSQDGKVVWEIKDAIPDTKITLKWTTFLTELDNGNFIVGNCHAGAKSPQIFEITRDKKVVWQFNQYDIFGNGLACSQVLNDQQSALVRKRIAKAVGAQYGAKRTHFAIGKHKGFILQPAKPAAEDASPWVWYAPTIGSHPTTATSGFCAKPAEQTPLTAIRMAELVLEAGFPEGVINIRQRLRRDRGRCARAPP